MSILEVRIQLSDSVNVAFGELDRCEIAICHIGLKGVDINFFNDKAIAQRHRERIARLRESERNCQN